MSPPGIAFTLVRRDGAGIPVAVEPQAAARIALAPVFMGAAGPSYVSNRIDVVATSDGGLEIPLPAEAPAGGTLFINGLVQPPDGYTVAGTTLTVSADLAVMAGDTITFIYPA